MHNTKFYIGIDVSKLWFDLSLMSVVNHKKQPMLSQRFDNTKEGLKAMHTWLKGHGACFDQTLLVIENTGVYHRLLWAWCSNHNLPIHIGNAARIKWSLGITRGKDDVVDSQRLCTYAFKNADELKATPPLNPVFMKLKDLMTARTQLLQQLNSTRSFLKELKLSNPADVHNMMEAAHKSAIEGLKKSIAQIEQQLRKLVTENEAIQRNYNLLLTVPGIGHLTALYLICCTNNFAGGITAKQLAAYAGVVPYKHQSGTSVKGRNKVHPMCNRELKSLLYLCATSSLRYYPEFRQYFERKKAEGKHSMSVINAIKNKIILRAVAVVNKQQKYVENPPKAA